MRVDSVLNIGTAELSQREWRSLFSKLRYVDDDGVMFEPWMVLPHKRVVRIPRGAWNLLPGHIEYEDARVCPPGVEFPFMGSLDQTTKDGRTFEGQKDALRTMLLQEQGLVIRPPGTGKTEIIVAFLALVATKSLVLVHTEDILQQWIARCEMLIPDASIGVIRGKEFRIGDVTIATVQTFRREINIRGKALAEKFGAVVLDEAHHAPASTFDEVLNQMPAKYRLGVTATDTRADGKHPYMRTVIGPVIYRQKFASKVPVICVPVKSHKFYYGFRGPWDWANLVNALVDDEKRNAVIAKIASAEIRQGNSILVLSRRIEHLEKIKAEITSKDGEVEILTGARTKVDRSRILADFRAGRVLCLLATQLADEALDVPILSRVILTFPGKHGGRLIQQIGRAIREHPEKEDAIIYDVVDEKVGVLRRQWMQRKQAYKQMKIKVKKGGVL
jgi:superfamily II DNA or RNA helicase